MKTYRTKTGHTFVKPNFRAIINSDLFLLSRFLTSAPCSIKYLMTSMCPFSVASINALWLVREGTFTSAPCSIKSFTISMYPKQDVFMRFFCCVGREWDFLPLFAASTIGEVLKPVLTWASFSINSFASSKFPKQENQFIIHIGRFRNRGETEPLFTIICSTYQWSPVRRSDYIDLSPIFN